MYAPSKGAFPNNCEIFTLEEILGNLLKEAETNIYPNHK